MTAVAWTAIGLLGATLTVLAGALSNLRAAIDAHGRDLRASIDGQGRSLGARIDALIERIDAQSLRIDTHLSRDEG